MATMKRRRRREPRIWRTADGDLLTPLDVAMLAREAEAGYDLAKAHVERPEHRSPDAGARPWVTIRAGTRLYVQVRARGATERRSLSDLAREALEQYIRRTDG